VINPADPREVDMPGAWFQSTVPDFKPSMFGHYPLHWYSHVMHCFEIVGTYHPVPRIAGEAEEVYERLVNGLHLNPEYDFQLKQRLTEDRIAADTVVS
jgi:hypothetical protein